MFTDMIGYTALGQKDESLSLALVEEQKKLIRLNLDPYGGREVKTMGDSLLVEFTSALNAVRCAFEIQKAVREFNLSREEGRKLHLRIGVHLGDIVESNGDISGDAVNVASRIEPLADDGGVCLTRQVFDHVENKFEHLLQSLGHKTLKNVRAPVEVFRMQMPWEAEGTLEKVGLDPRRVAVLPLRNMSPDPNDEFFADGMTEELITALSGIGELTVIARTSVMQYKSSPKRIVEVGRELRAGTVIEGSVRKAASKVRITVQMVDSTSEGHLWAQNYDRQMDDIFAIQSEIAEKVAGALKLKLVESEKQKIEKKPTGNTEAYTLYLKGKFYWNERNKSSVEKGIAYLNKAMEADPNFALAYSDMASAYVVMAEYGMMDGLQAVVKAGEYAAKALALDPGLSAPHSVLATIRERNYDWDSAEREHRLAIGLNPNNPTAYHWFSLTLGRRGRMKEAIVQSMKAKELDPLSPIVNVAHSRHLIDVGRIEEALKILREVVEMNDQFLLGHISLGMGLTYVGLKDEAVGEMEKALAIQKHGQALSPIASVYARVGHADVAKRLLADLLETSKKEYVDPFEISAVYADLGDKTQALEWLKKSVEERSPRSTMILIADSFKPLRENPKFKELLRQVGLSQGRRVAETQHP